MPEASITTYSKEADRLYQRGVAAARGGQRRIAAGLLMKAVQLDPRHEQAWLWLSGVLDDPQEVEFCLHSALKINPQNQQAQKGLAWLKKRRSEVGYQPPPKPTPTALRLSTIVVPEEGVIPKDPQKLSWWEDFRQSQVWQRKVRITTLAVLIVLLLGTGLITRSIDITPLPELPVIPTALPQSSTSQQQAVLAAPENAQADIVRYMSDISGLRNSLDTASATYKATSDTSTVAAEQIDAARIYRDTLRETLVSWSEIAAPGQLQQLHDEYLQGLELELAAFEDILEYYTNYNIAIANRAALRLQEANGHYQRAQVGWQVYSAELQSQSLGNNYGLR